ncbi:2-succinyl-6-hydroxy-2,4-cyclohexadiene-1-carboxylate synthase [Scopulibacillus daqui]|uniref:Putative 2-succinyl-6-hydroxy-2,4-cyclohexadiene-1-carboxylate synthase n=1 Tax=Scopulibacillus daqui TaxID=1469162 RepID=A0ABS2PV26_9BACL|nr:2-succinyl-6-hydroxy-2,4-cyclohexadiene-1-carboxylate synthase [Scopulibacillus daqui]MBM7643906.1 2-succinyl-6-hydroxy-2,4-cyclohexadiene-1-carboxylate synthase [Scopulibacillus daqui]
MIEHIETLGVKHAVRVTGDGEPLLLLHGFTGSMGTWEPFVEKWSKSFKVIAIDIVGHGQTIAPDDVSCYKMEHEAASIMALLDQLNIKKTHLLGYSMGGRLALFIKIYYPEQTGRLLLESSSPGLGTERDRAGRKQRDDELADRIEADGVENFINEWEKIPLFKTQETLPESVRKKIRQERLNQTAKGLANSLRGMGTGVQPPLWNDIRTISSRVSLVVGSLDKKFVDIGQAMAQRMPNAAFHIVPDAGHAIHVEQPQIFDKIVMDDFKSTL